MTDLNESELKVFVDAVKNYFSHLTSDAVLIRAAYLSNTLISHHDYTGLITISGRFRGCVYFSAPARLLRALLHALREPDTSEDNLLDAVGEIANTIAGNARKHFGTSLTISIPVTIRGVPEQIKSAARARSFAIVLNWSGYDATVIVDLAPVDSFTS